MVGHRWGVAFHLPPSEYSSIGFIALGRAGKAVRVQCAVTSRSGRVSGVSPRSNDYDTKCNSVITHLSRSLAYDEPNPFTVRRSRSEMPRSTHDCQ